MRRGHKDEKKKKMKNKKPWLSWGICFFMTAALAGNQILGGYAPFALGGLAAAGSGADGFCALAGAVAGALIFMEFQDALPFLASCALTLAASIAFRGNKILSRPRAVSIYTAVLFLSIGCVYAADSSDPGAALIPCFAAAGLSGASAWFFWPLFHPDCGRPVSESVLFLTASILLAMRDISIAGLSFGRMLLCVLLVYTGFIYGSAAGTASGLCLGFIAELCASFPDFADISVNITDNITSNITNGHTGLLAASLGLGGLLCGQYAAGRRHVAALAFLGGTMTMLLLTGDPWTNPLLIECGTGMFIFLMLPERLFGANAEKRVENNRIDSSAGKLKERLNRAAVALRDLYESCGENDLNIQRENPAVIFDQAAERVCRRCNRCETCWQSEYTATFQAMNAAAPAILERGHAEIDDFSPAFTDHCHYLTRFIAAIDTETRAYLLRQRYRKQLDEVRRGARGQYIQLSDLLTAVASGPSEKADLSFKPDYNNINIINSETGAALSRSDSKNTGNPGNIGNTGKNRPGKRIASRRDDNNKNNYNNYPETYDERINAAIYSENQNRAAFSQDSSLCRFGSVLRPKAGERVCGDTALSFRTDDGLWCLLLADGMGSGEAARRESALICRLLRQFLEAGIYPEAALRTLNSAMALRGSDGFTTMDLCVFNPESGEASFYKYGAAPSYLKKGVSVKRVTGSGLPVGLRDAPAPPDITRIKLDPGGFIALVSDGIVDARDDQWLQDMLSDWDGDEPQELADAILNESVRRRQSRDDCGVLILYRPIHAAKRV